jgi:hypothetical protein
VTYEWNGDAPAAVRKPGANPQGQEFKARKPSGHAGH